MSKVSFIHSPVLSRLTTTNLPRPLVDRTRGVDAPTLIARIRGQQQDVSTLAWQTGLSTKKVEGLIFGPEAPVSHRGTWTRPALKLAQALRTEPNELFPEAQAIVDAGLTRPDEELFPPCLIGELYPKL